MGNVHIVLGLLVIVNGVNHFTRRIRIVCPAALLQLFRFDVQVRDLPFSEGLIRSLNLLPCSYLLYYFKQKEMLAIEMGEYYKGGARAQVAIARSQSHLL